MEGAMDVLQHPRNQKLLAVAFIEFNVYFATKRFVADWVSTALLCLIWLHLGIAVATSLLNSKVDALKGSFHEKIKELKSKSASTSVTAASRPSLPFKPLPSAKQATPIIVDIPFPFQEVAVAYWKKVREPLPDPDFPPIKAVEEVSHNVLPEFKCILRKRKLQIGLETVPNAVKKVLQVESVAFEEQSIEDQEEQRLIIQTDNVSFRSLGLLREHSVYEKHPTNPNWTKATIRTQVKGNSFTGKMLISTALGADFSRETVEASLALLRKRLQELFGQKMKE